MSWPDVADRRLDRPGQGMMEPKRECTCTPVLNLILCRTGSQWNSRRTGVTWSRLLAPVTNRAAAFYITCIFAAVDYLQQWAHCYSNQVDKSLDENQQHLVRRRGMSEWPELYHAEKARPTESSGVVGHGELTVDKNSQVIDNSWTAAWLIRTEQSLFAKEVLFISW